MCYDYKIIEDLLPNKIRKSRDRPNVSGADKEWCDKRGYNYKGYHPTNIINGKKERRISYGIPCESITFGKSKQFFCKNPQLQECRANIDYPLLYNELKKMISIIAPNHKYDSITLNHNFKCVPHYDAKNKSPSVIVGLGDYAGGECVVEGVAYNIKHNPLSFNGSFLRHWTNNFCGERWSVVYYLKWS